MKIFNQYHKWYDLYNRVFRVPRDSFESFQQKILEDGGMWPVGGMRRMLKGIDEIVVSIDSFGVMKESKSAPDAAYEYLDPAKGWELYEGGRPPAGCMDSVEFACEDGTKAIYITNDHKWIVGDWPVVYRVHRRSGVEYNWEK